jgi:hypothetical protein
MSFHVGVQKDEYAAVGVDLGCDETQCSVNLVVLVYFSFGQAKRLQYLDSVDPQSLRNPANEDRHGRNLPVPSDDYAEFHSILE